MVGRSGVFGALVGGGIGIVGVGRGLEGLHGWNFSLIDSYNLTV